MDTLADLLGLNPIPDIEVKDKSRIHIYKMMNLKINKTQARIQVELPMSVVQALKISSRIRVHRQETTRKPRVSRVTDEDIIRMNMLYEKGAIPLKFIGEAFCISETYCGKLVRTYRVANKLPALSKKDRGVIANGYTKREVV